MTKRSKIIIIIALALIFIRIINPIMVATRNGITTEADPLFDKGEPAYQFVLYYGATSMTNLLHIFYIILFATVIIYLVEKT
jgi:flagellar biosynthesis protein FlhB